MADLSAGRNIPSAVGVFRVTCNGARFDELPRSVLARSKAPRSRFTLAALVGVLVVSASALIAATNRFGIGMSRDSVAYVEGARHIADGSGYASSGRPVTQFAPGYSALLSVGERFGLDAVRGARLLSVAALCVAISLSYMLLRRHVYSQKVVIAGTIAVAFSSVLLAVYQEAMSEHVFVVVVLLFVLAAEEHVRSPRALWPLAALIALSWSAFYLRYAGIVFIGIAGVLVLVVGARRGVLPAMVRSAVVVAAGVCVPALWMKRNIDLIGSPLGSRHDAAASLGTNVSRTIEEFESWLTSDWIAPWLRHFVFVAAIAAVVATIILFSRARFDIRDEAREMFPLALVVGLYVVYLAVTASVVAFAAIDFRFLSPVFVPMIILAAWVADRAYRLSAAPTTRALVVGVGVAWLAAAVLAFGQQVIDSRANGAGGYATARWHNSKLISDVRQLDPAVLTLSNDPQGIELFTGRVVQPSVRKLFFGSSESADSLDAFVHKIMCSGRAQLVWFEPNYAGFLYSIEELGQRLQLTPISKQRDGVIYDVRPKVVGPRPRCNR